MSIKSFEGRRTVPDFLLRCRIHKNVWFIAGFELTRFAESVTLDTRGNHYAEWKH